MSYYECDKIRWSLNGDNNSKELFLYNYNYNVGSVWKVEKLTKNVQCLDGNPIFLQYPNVYGHITLKAPVLV